MDLAVLFQFVIKMLSEGNILGAFMALSLIGFVLMWKKLNKLEAKTKEEAPKPKKNYNQFIEKDSLIADELDFIRRKYSADRVIVVELMNGSYSLGNIATLKTFVRSEKTKTGIAPSSNQLNGVPVSFYSKIFRKLVTGDVYCLPKIEDLISDDFGLYQNLSNANIKSFYAFPLISDGVLYGAVFVDYCVERKVFDEQELEDLWDEMERINGEILMMKKLSN